MKLLGKEVLSEAAILFTVVNIIDGLRVSDVDVLIMLLISYVMALGVVWAQNYRKGGGGEQ